MFKKAKLVYGIRSQDSDFCLRGSHMGQGSSTMLMIPVF